MNLGRTLSLLGFGMHCQRFFPYVRVACLSRCSFYCPSNWSASPFEVCIAAGSFKIFRIYLQWIWLSVGGTSRKHLEGCLLPVCSQTLNVQPSAKWAVLSGCERSRYVSRAITELAGDWSLGPRTEEIKTVLWVWQIKDLFCFNWICS